MVGFLVAGPFSGSCPTATGPAVRDRRHGYHGHRLRVDEHVAGNFHYARPFPPSTCSSLALAWACSPHRTAPPIMNSVPVKYRGVASGMRATFMNAGPDDEHGHFLHDRDRRSWLRRMPHSLDKWPESRGRARTDRTQDVRPLPPTASLFAALLGYNPLSMVPCTGDCVPSLPCTSGAPLLARPFFPP